MIRVSIASPQELVVVDRGAMRRLVRAVLEEEDVRDAQISLAFVDNATIQPLNRRYLDHDEPTDVLSFPLSEGKARLAGELVIGVEVAQEQARERGHDVQAELSLYVIHGLLHLCGHEDETEAGVRAMRGRERRVSRIVDAILAEAVRCGASRGRLMTVWLEALPRLLYPLALLLFGCSIIGFWLTFIPTA